MAVLLGRCNETDQSSEPNELSEKGVAQTSVDVRMCKDCKHTIFSKSDFAKELAFEPPDQRAYQNLKQFERGIRMMMPRFQRLLTALQYAINLPSILQR